LAQVEKLAPYVSESIPTFLSLRIKTAC